MKIHGVRLYPLLIAGVLAVTACGGEKTENVPSAAAADSLDPISERPSRAEGPAGGLSPEADGPTVLFFGDSITAGLGIDPDSAFTAVLQRRADSLGIPARMINAGLSGETSAGGRRRIGWLLRQNIDIFVLELGGNDGLRGITLADTRNNLLGIIDTVLAAGPSTRVIVAGMMIPPNLGPDYTSGFRDLFPEVADARQAILIPFLLEGVGGVEALMQNDGVHPTVDGHRVIAETVWPYLEPLLRQDP